ncbi:MAG: acyltransferase, partial [Acidimicrobiales bacterium]
MDWARLPWRMRYRYAAGAGSELRRAMIVATHRHTRVEIARPFYLGPGFDLIIPGTGEFVAGAGAEFRRGFVAEVSDGGRVTVGAGCTFTSFALIQCSTEVTIGSRVVFGQNLMIADGNHRFRDHTRHMLEQGYDFRPVTIGDNALITSKCTILADVGEGSVIGSNSVVTKPIPAFCLAAGSPAKVIEYFGP